MIVLQRNGCVVPEQSTATAGSQFCSQEQGFGFTLEAKEESLGGEGFLLNRYPYDMAILLRCLYRETQGMTLENSGLIRSETAIASD